MSEHGFCGKHECVDGFFYDVDADNVCLGCKKKLKIIVIG